MRPAASILGWISVGAIAAGLGTGAFLYKANLDRDALAREKDAALAHADELIRANELLADQANDRLDRASEEVRAAEARIKALETERALIAEAKPLSRTGSSARWPEYVNFPLGISLRLPTTARDWENSTTTFIAGARQIVNEGVDPWLVIRGYRPELEQEWNARLLNGVPVTYMANGRLFTGLKGRLREGGPTAMSLRLQANASSTHAFWIVTGTGLSEANALEALATVGLRP